MVEGGTDTPSPEWSVRKVHEACSALLVNQSSNYDTVKYAVLKAYKLVLEEYLQKFQTSKKNYCQTYEFARAKETLFGHWHTIKEISGDFGRLPQLVRVNGGIQVLFLQRYQDVRTWMSKK